nr:RNA-dependent RNA polymerase CDS [Astacus astacus]
MSNFKNLILNQLDADIEPRGLVVDPYNVIQKSVTPRIPQYEIIYVESKGIKTSFSVNFVDYDDVATGTTLTQSMDLVYQIKDTSTFIHDFTIEPLEIDTDKRLDSIFNKRDDGYDKITPDSIWPSTNGYLVMEYTTRITRRDDKLKQAFDDKISAYRQALLNRLNGKFIRFDVLVINPECVLTNSKYVTQDMVDEMCFRYIIAQSIVTQLNRDGIKTREEDEEESQRQREVSAIFSSITMNETDKLMNQDYYEAIISPCSQSEVKRAVDDCINKANLDTEEKLSKQYEWDPRLKKAIGSSIQENFISAKKMCTEYIDSHKGNESFRNVEDLKSVVQLPFWVLKEGDGSIGIAGDDLNFLNFGGCEDATYQIWKSVATSICMGEVQRLDEDTNKEFRIAMGEEKGDVDQKSQYHRVTVDMDSDILESIQKVGVMAGGRNVPDSVKTYRAEKKKSFPMDCNLDDIDSFVSNKEIWKSSYTYNRSDAVIDSLIESSRMHDNEEVSQSLRKKVEGHLGSDIGRFSTFVSDLASELCASLKQHCKNKQFIIKKLRHFDVYVLIKPTDSSKHIFFSLLVYNTQIDKSIGKPFKTTSTDGTFTWTEFVSVNQSKLVNLVMSESNILSVNSFMWHFYGMVPWEDLEMTQDMVRFANVNILVMLHDKAQVEEIVTNMRYVMMEGFVSIPNMPNPQKMMVKLPDRISSRLSVWIIHKFLDSILRICSGHFFQPLDTLLREEGEIAWINLFNPLTGDKLLDPYQVINSFYVGYWKNKDERPESNTIGKMFQKILDLEDQNPKSPSNLGYESPLVDELSYHEYNADFLKKLCDHAMDYFRDTMGQNWKEEIDREIRSKLAFADIESHSTLKASSTFGPEYYVPSKGKVYYRKKVMEAMWGLANNSEIMMMELVPKCLSKLEELDGLQVDIFRKNQHGGLREIYVLTAEGRVIQLVLETIAKVLCMKFPSETMTHPKNKSKIPENHARVVKKAYGSDSITIACSADAKKWNQGHHVAKFGMLLCRLTPKLYHPFIIRALRLWINKKIMIPQQLLDIFDKNPHLISSDPIVQRMSDCYQGRAIEKWMESGKAYVHTDTGMMQGILHYTSSLLHSVLLKYYQDLITIRCKLMLSGQNLKPLVFVSTQQSSDDSSVLMSFGLEKSDRLKGLILSSFCFSLKKHLSRLVAIYDSPKTTDQTVSIMEFNSEFFIHGNQFRPTLRWVAAVNRISESEALSARQEQMSNLLTEVLEGGGSIYLCSMLQMGQGLLHYRLLGSSMSGLFDEYLEAVSQIKDPSTGYFLMDSPVACGLLGFKYNLWNVLTKNPSLSSKFKLMLEEMSKAIPELINRGVQYKTLETSTSGSFINSIIITWGNRKKWTRLIESLNLPEDWLESVNKRPEILYKRPATHDELAIKLAVKVHSPGVSESLSKGNAIARVMASSTYIISRSVLRDASMWKMKDTDCKQSLLKLALDDLQFLDGTAYDGLEITDLSILFPFYSDYYDIRDNLVKIKALRGKIQSTSFKRRTTHISITESDGDYLLKPVDLASWKWFSHDKIAAARRVKDAAWTRLKNVFKWLKDDPYSTLEESPFTSQIQLQNFLARLERKNRLVHLSGVSVKSIVGRSNMLTAIYQNFFPGFTLDPLHDERKTVGSKSSKALFHALYMIGSLPIEESRMKTMQYWLLKDSDPILWNSNFSRSRRNMLRIIQDYIKGASINAVLEKLYTNKLGVIGGYLKPQRAVIRESEMIYEGEGIWLGAAGDVAFRVEIDSRRGQNQAMAIIVNDVSELPNTMAMINSWLKDNGISTTWNSSDPDTVAKVLAGKVTLGKNGSGCPIILNKSLTYSFDPSYVDKLEIVYRQYTINLRATIKHGFRIRSHNILSVSFRHDDINSELGAQMKISRNILDTYQRWIRCQPLDSNLSGSILLKISRNESIQNMDSSKVRPWARELVKDSLSRRSILPQVVRFETSEIMTELERSELLRRAEEMAMTQDMGSLLAMIDQEFVTPDGNITLNGMSASDIFQGIDISIFDPVDTRRSPARSHAYFDEWANWAISKYSSIQLKKLFQDNVLTTATAELVPIAAFILDKPENSFGWEEDWAEMEGDEWF